MKNAYDFLNETVIDLAVYENTKITTKELESMKNNFKNLIKTRHKNKKGLIAALCAAIILTSCTVVLASNVIKRMSTGYNVFNTIESDTSYKLPDELKGCFYDENGIELEEFTIGCFDNVYDKNGYKLSEKDIAKLYEKNMGTYVTTQESNNKKYYVSLQEAESNTSFDLKLPGYLPKGYSFAAAYGYVDENGNVSSEYICIEYTDGENTIYFYERAINDDTAFEAGAAEIEEIPINGRVAALLDNSSIHWETVDAVSVSISINKNVSKQELINIAESVE